MEAAGEGRAEGWFQIMRAIRAVGGRIIEFLAQIEEFQKMLWEKRKFITETQLLHHRRQHRRGLLPGDRRVRRAVGRVAGAVPR